jgi:Threonine synthase N terminus
MLLQGGAKDGGLFVPVDDLPWLSVGELSRLANLTYAERALRIIEKLIHPRDIPPSILSDFIKQAYIPGNAVHLLCFATSIFFVHQMIYFFNDMCEWRVTVHFNEFSVVWVRHIVI